MRHLKFAIAILGFCALACGGRDKDGDEGETDDSGDEGGGSQKPSITEADAWCGQTTSGEVKDLWFFKATATDPQGTDTLENLLSDGVTVMSGDTVVTTVAIAFDDSGTGSTSGLEEAVGASCDSPSAYTVLFAVEDEDGNRSADFEVTGRQGTDANGKRSGQEISGRNIGPT